MESSVLGLILDTSVLIAAERSKLKPAEAIESVQRVAGPIPIALSVVTVAEIGHGIYRALDVDVRRRRREFLDELKATIPVYPLTDATAEIMARIGGEQGAKGVNLPFADLAITATALELEYAVGTSNMRDFNRMPGLQIVAL